MSCEHGRDGVFTMLPACMMCAMTQAIVLSEAVIMELLSGNNEADIGLTEDQAVVIANTVSRIRAIGQIDLAKVTKEGPTPDFFPPKGLLESFNGEGAMFYLTEMLASYEQTLQSAGEEKVH